MPTPGERRALIFLASVAALGVAARGWKEWHTRSVPGVVGDGAGLARQREAVDSAIAVGSNRRRASKAPRGPRVADGAGKSGTPRIAQPGRTGASPTDESGAPDRDVRALYRWRRAHHDSLPFADLRDRALARPRARTSESAPARAVPPPGRSQSVPSLRQSELAPPPRLDLDIATAAEIAALPWIGRALAMQIVADRQAHGSFGSLTELQRVPGIGPGTAARLQPFVTFSVAPRLGSTVENWPRARRRRRPGG